MSKSSYQEFLSKPEISFWVPIITSIVLISATFFALSTEVQISNVKLDNLLTLVQDIKDERKGESQLSMQVQSHVCKLDTIHQISCINGD
jgi:hypothetical protein